MNAMIGSSNEREIPIVALENLMESGVSLLVLDYTSGEYPVGYINVECGSYTDEYDLQESNKAVCLNVGSRGDITSFRKFSVSIEYGAFRFTVFTIPTRYTGGSTNWGNITTDSYLDWSESDRYLNCSFSTDIFHALVIAERFS